MREKQLDVNDLSNYRPIASLPLTANILEWYVAMTLRRYLNDYGINDMFQSAYHLNHSTETALVFKALNTGALPYLAALLTK